MNCEWICTNFEDNKVLTDTKILEVKNDNNCEMNAVNLYEKIQYQIFEGFGGAATEAAAYTWAQMSPEKQEELLEAYFGKGGCNYKFVRLSLDSCDFSLNHYQAVNDPEDTKFKSFSLERDEKYVIPFLRAAEKKAGEKLNILLSPWSPPAFMKTTGQRNFGGKLKPECRGAWAEYICRYIEEYGKLGFEVKMLTIQNEPNAKQTWDSCLYTGAEEKAFLKEFLYPAIKRHGLDIDLYIWDHNKERALERTLEIVDEQTRSMLKGVAFHWYTGEHFDTLRMIREIYPELKLAFTEGCVEYSRFDSGNRLAHARMYAQDIIGNLNAGMNFSIDWNLYLDQHGGPNHVSNFCDAPIHCNTETGELDYKLSYNYLKHFSKYIQPGSVRIGSSKYTERMEVTAFKNPDGSIACVFLNKGDKTLPLSVRFSGKVLSTELPGDAIATLVIAE